MRPLALASDYDGTIAQDGKVNTHTLSFLEQFSRAGHKLILVTGRQLPELLQVFPETSLFDRVIAENGALYYDPTTRECRRLADKPSILLFSELERNGAEPLSLGESIIATVRPHDQLASHLIQTYNLPYQIIYNKEAVMLLPVGIDKATGLRAAVQDLRLDYRSLIGVGDAENDLVFLRLCGFSVAVSNAIDTLKANVDHITSSARGEGVSELIQDLLSQPDFARPV